MRRLQILYDPQKKNSDGTPRSKGIAFVQFTEHQHAIVALRELNNNPSVFHPDRRPIVEFAIEDVKKLAIRERRQRLNAPAAEEGNTPPRGCVPSARTAPLCQRRTALSVSVDRKYWLDPAIGSSLLERDILPQHLGHAQYPVRSVVATFSDAGLPLCQRYFLVVE